MYCARANILWYMVLHWWPWAYSEIAYDVEALGLVRECRELEQRYSSNFTTQIRVNTGERLHGRRGLLLSTWWLLREAGKYLIKEDQDLLLAGVLQYVHLQRVAKGIRWRKLWDHAMDHGKHVVKGIKNLLRVIAYPDHTTKKSPLCDTTELNLQCLPKHFISEHTSTWTAKVTGKHYWTLWSPWTLPFIVMYHALILYIPHFCTFCVHLVYAQAGQRHDIISNGRM